MKVPTRYAMHVASRGATRKRLLAALRRPLPTGPSTQFDRDPDHEWGGAAWPATAKITPAARLAMGGEPMMIDGDVYHVDQILPATRGKSIQIGLDLTDVEDEVLTSGGTQRDVLILRGTESMRCDERSVCRAMQVRDLEVLIDQDRVEFPYQGYSGRDLNLARGWNRGGRTLACLGITLGAHA